VCGVAREPNARRGRHHGCVVSTGDAIRYRFLTARIVSRSGSPDGDSLAVWEQKLEQRGGTVDLGLNANLRRIAEDYSLKAPETAVFDFTVDADAAIQRIWSRANARLDAADALYRGEQPRSTLPKP